ncbi:MAG: Malto-oligosyltrehalose trehalohydrolase [Chlamydiae bacterium]|nr:Malto-oligosyltrehalose trehalohydrolase [Chlamydiota bacterium]
MAEGERVKFFNTALQWQLDLGARYHKTKGGVFKIWAPHHDSLLVKIEGKGAFPLQPTHDGYFGGEISEAEPQDRYFYQFENGLLRPDPISRSLPDGVHGATMIIDPDSFAWADQAWQLFPLREAIFYELHVGTFSPEGTFAGVIDKISYFKELGINFIELMPVAEFPGRWNWGYDGASLYAPYHGYGGPNGLKELVNACHLAGIGVCLDVVYNHPGPEGSYLGEFGPYFSGTYHTPWGKAFNYDGAYSDYVRDYVIKNALYWISEYHIDALRLDAIHSIYDFSASTLISELSQAIQSFEREAYVVAESDLNDSKIIRVNEEKGLSALWNDDFHHAAHVALTGEQTTYYNDFNGLQDLAKAMTEGFVYDGKYSSFRKKRHGNRAAGVPFEKFIVFIQNHDQIGNRPMGDRLSAIMSHKRLKVGALLCMMTPAIPLLFMGQEYAEKHPFAYFTDYEDEKLMRAVYEGRKREFHREDMPFPGRDAFQNSKLSWDIKAPDCRDIFKLYKELISLRQLYPPKPGLKDDGIKVYFSTQNQWIAWEYQTNVNDWIGMICHLDSKENLTLPIPFIECQSKELLLTTEKVEFTKSKITLLPESAVVII